MGNNMIYKLRIMILETYVRITMIGYESKQNALMQDRHLSSSYRGGHNNEPNSNHP